MRQADSFLESLASLDLLRGLPSPALREASGSARFRTFSRNSRIFNQGDAGVRAHILIEGLVRISQSGSDGTQSVMRFIAPGEMFGTMGLFTDGRYPADAETLTDAVEVSWSEADLLKLMTHYPQIAISALTIVGQRLQEVQNRMRELSTQRVEQRLAHALLRLIKQAGHVTPGGIAIEFFLRRKDIADLSGTTVYSASRVLAAWQRAGWLISREQCFLITRSDEIQRIADGGHA